MESIGWEYCRKTCGRECTEEILDFANMVFGMEYGRTDFASLLPKAYAPERCGIPVHHMIMEENRLRALIDVYPLTLRLKGRVGVQSTRLTWGPCPSTRMPGAGAI